MSGKKGKIERISSVESKPLKKTASEQELVPNYCIISNDYKFDILASELLDTEHDLNRAPGQVSPLYLYTYELFDREGHRALSDILYNNKDRVKRLSVDTIKKNMNIILKRYNPNIIEYASILTNKSINGLRAYIAHEDNGYNFVNPLVVETIKGASSDDMTDSQGNTNTRRYELSNIFDNGCAISSLPKIPVNETLKEVISIYPNHFPQAASVFVLKSYLTGSLADTVGNDVMNLIGNQATSIVPIQTNIRDSLIEFIDYIKTNIGHDNSSVYLLHIFRNLEYGDDAETNVKMHKQPSYTFSLQRGQITVNEVTLQMGWGQKRNTCFGSSLYEDINSLKMIFSAECSNLMKNCHAAYGKLCGDGVTAYAISEYYRNAYIHKPAILSIDEFCCLRTNIALTRWFNFHSELQTASFQQKPTSRLSGFGGGLLTTTRTTDVITYNKTAVPATTLLFDAKTNLFIMSENRLKQLITNGFHAVGMNNVEQLLKNINDGFWEMIKPYVQATGTFSFSQEYSYKVERADEVLKQIIEDTEKLNAITDFGLKYIDALVDLTDVVLIVDLTDGGFSGEVKEIFRIGGRGSRRVIKKENEIIDTFFSRLSLIESLFEQEGMPTIKSRIQITYIMITTLLMDVNFTNKIIMLVNYLFGNDTLIESLRSYLINHRTVSIDSIVSINPINKYINDFLTDNANPDPTISNYKEKYIKLLAIHNEMPATVVSNEDDKKLKLTIRRNLVILKYLIRALAIGYYAATNPPPNPYASPNRPGEIEIDENIDDITTKIIQNKERLTFDNILKAYQNVTSSIKGVETPMKTPGMEADTDPNNQDTLMSLFPYHPDSEEDNDDRNCDHITPETSSASSATSSGRCKGGTRRKRRSRKPKRTRKGRKTGSKVKTRRRRYIYGDDRNGCGSNNGAVVDKHRNGIT